MSDTDPADRFDLVSPETIAAGDATDAYFDRTVEALDAAGRDPHVVAEVTVSQFPDGEFDVFAGVKDAAHLLEGVPVDVDALPEGALFDGGPVLTIEGQYRDFARYETALLGFLSQASAFATAALEARRAAPDSLVVSFGSRHLHPSLAVVLERAALVAGLDGFSNTAAGEALGRDASGTMPHALVLCFGRGDQRAAWRAFDEGVPDDTPRVALCDTFDDEVSETLAAVDELGDALDSVRIDTTSSRRGDYAHIVREVRWHLDARDHEDVGIFCSGGMTPDAMRAVREYADGFGVGSHVTGADPINFALDIVEVEGEAVAKRGKLPGRKQVYRTPTGGHAVALADESVEGNALLRPLVRGGDVVREFDLDAAAARSADDAERVGFRN